MKESELYAKYITACRTGNKKEIDQMIQQGFRPDKQRLIELSNSNPDLQKILFNRRITIHIDMGNTAGHVYGKFPIYDELRTNIKEEFLGFYPSKLSGISAFMGEGSVLDERQDSKRVLENFDTITVSLPLTEEAWRNLANWTSGKKKEKASYVLTSTNCVHFIHSALQLVGYSDGLIDKFNPKDVNKLKFKPVMLDLNNYLRYDKREDLMPVLNQVLESRGSDMQNGSYVRLYHQAQVQREQANKITKENFVNGFYDYHHNVHFYQKLYRNKALSLNDMSWLLRNKAPGMENRIRDTLWQSYNMAPTKLKQRYQFNPKIFFWHLSYQLQTCPQGIDPELQKLLSSSGLEREQAMISLYPNTNNLTVCFASSFCFAGSFLYWNSGQQLAMQCENVIGKEKSDRNQARKSAFILESQAFSRDCERSLDKTLGFLRFSKKEFQDSVHVLSAKELSSSHIASGRVASNHFIASHLEPDPFVSSRNLGRNPHRNLENSSRSLRGQNLQHSSSFTIGSLSIGSFSTGSQGLKGGVLVSRPQSHKGFESAALTLQFQSLQRKNGGLKIPGAHMANLGLKYLESVKPANALELTKYKGLSSHFSHNSTHSIKVNKGQPVQAIQSIQSIKPMKPIQSSKK